MSVPAGWYPDPAGSPGVRWFDGASWTAETGPAAATDVISYGPDAGWAGTARVPLWRRGTVVGVAAAVLLAGAGTLFILGRFGSSSTPTASSAAPTTRVPTALSRPTVGDCHRYDYTAMQRPTEPTPTVSCAGGTATAMTIAVLPLPAGTQLPFENHPASVQAAGQGCQSQLETYLGGGTALPISRLSVAFFEPTPAQVTAGQRWVRCDVWLAGVAHAGTPVLLPLPQGSLKGALAGAGAWTYALCAKPTAANAAGWLSTVDCRSAGSQVAVAPVPIAATGAPYPGVKKASALATHVCTVVSRWYGGLRLRGAAEPAKVWTGSAVCLASPSDFQSWLAAGRPFAPPQSTA